MATSRRNTPKPATPAEPEVAPREPRYPSWYAKEHWFGPQHTTTSIKTLVEEVRAGLYRLPRFQRDYVWTDEQIIRMFDSMLSGYHVGSMLLWDRFRRPASVERFAGVEVACPAQLGSAYLVVDGQQRLGAIVSAAMSGRFWFDLRTGRVVTGGPGAWLVPMGDLICVDRTPDYAAWARQHADQHGLDADEVQDGWRAAYVLTERPKVSSVILNNHCTLPMVVESFRRLNTEGTPMDPVMLEAALRRAMDQE